LFPAQRKARHRGNDESDAPFPGANEKGTPLMSTTRRNRPDNQRHGDRETHGRNPQDQPFVGENPKKPADAADDGASNRIKDPDDWVSGDEPMTGAQASYLKTLSEEAHEPDAFDANLGKAEASKRIDRLKEKLGL
jgi:hypothetical protein